jgi:hypothetical protein
MITNPRDEYEQWLRRKPISRLVMVLFAFLFGAQVFVWSREAGAPTATGRGLVAALAVGLIGTFFMRLVESDLRSRLDAASPASKDVGWSGQLVVLPTPWKALYYLMVPAIVVGVSLAFMWSTNGASSGGSALGWVFVIFSMVFTVMFIWGGWLFVHNAKLVLTDDSLIKTNWRGATSLVTRTEIARVLRLAFDRSGVSGRGTWITRYWVFDSSLDGALIVINQPFWPRDEMEVLVGRLGVPVEGSWNEVLKPKEVRRRVKGVVRWTTAHPWIVIIGAVMLSLALIVLLIALLSPTA